MAIIDPKSCLYVSDVDGTLLEPKSKFSTKSVNRLNRLIDRGLQFTIATARNYDSVHPILHEVQFQIPVILFNGVYLTQFETGENLQLSNFISKSVVHHLLEKVLPLNLDPFIYTYGKRHKLYYRNTPNPGTMNYFNHLEGDGRLHKIKKYEFLEEESIAGFLLIDTFQTLEPIYHSLLDQYPEDLNLYFAEDIEMPGYYWLQMFHRNADKGSMLKKLADHLSIPLTKTIVFGDYLNDLEMFQIAGKSIAVANALPEVKAQADQIISSNAESGVLNYLESLDF